MSKSAQPESMKRYLLTQSLIMSALCGIIVGFLMYAFYLGSEMSRYHTPLINATMEIKYEASIAHLYLEEILTGDREENVELDVYWHLRLAKWYVNAMLHGGANHEGVFQPLKDPVLREKVMRVDKHLDDLLIASEKRLILHKKAGSEMDVAFDAEFDSFMVEIDQVETELQSNQANLHQHYEWAKYVLVGLTCSLFAMAIVFQFRHQREKNKSLLQLTQARCEADERLNQLNNAIRSMGDALIMTDAEGLIINMNPKAEELTGWKKAEALNQNVQQVYQLFDAKSREPVQSPTLKTLNKGGQNESSRDVKLQSRSGQSYYVVDNCTAIRDKACLINGCVLVFADATADREFEARQQQDQKMQAIGTLAGGIAHDFNNMLGGIMGSSELLELHLDNDPVAKKYTGMINDAGRRAADLASNLLAFSRNDQVPSTPIDLHAVINDTLALLENTLDRRIEQQIDLSSSKSVVIGDYAQLQSVFLNLAINASHAMPNGGTLRIRTSYAESGGCDCDSKMIDFNTTSYIRVQVLDTGTGISEEHLDKIFEPFFTTKGQDKGTGLGLAISYGVIKQHGGCIEVKSEEGEGSCFSILLPLTTKEAVDHNDHITPVQGSGTVLLVDDEEVMRLTGKSLLKEYGYDVLVAENGQEAIEVYDQHQDEIQLVILDMIMPVMAGRDCFHQLRKRNSSLPIIVASGYMKEKDLQDLRDHGLNELVSKPYSGAVLSRKVAKCLGLSSPEDEHVLTTETSESCCSHDKNIVASTLENKPVLLLVDDDQITLEILSSLFTGQELKVIRCLSLKQAETAIAEQMPFMIISDINLADGKSPAFYSRAIDEGLTSKLVLISGNMIEDEFNTLGDQLLGVIQKPIRLDNLKTIVIDQLKLTVEQTV